MFLHIGVKKNTKGRENFSYLEVSEYIIIIQMHGPSDEMHCHLKLKKTKVGLS